VVSPVGDEGRTINEPIRAVDIVGVPDAASRDKQGASTLHDVLVPILKRAMNAVPGTPARLMPKISAK
jgi:hypothetical protein